MRELFSRYVDPVIDKVLGLRCTSYGYQYSEIAGSLSSVYFCGGDCAEDVTSHLMPHPFMYLRSLFSLKSVKTVPVCTDIQSNSLPLPANSLTMEQKFGKNSIDIEALREFCEREGKEVTYRKGDQLEREGDHFDKPFHFELSQTN